MPAVKRIALSVAVAAAMFVGLGTVAALWETPLFMRMTPTGEFEITLLLLLSVLAGIYVGLPRTECGKRTAGTGGVIGFLGIACPVTLAELSVNEHLFVNHGPCRSQQRRRSCPP
ncbi:MAG: hypothetical protein A2W68_13480 [Betaproteobacteria bacterium RIFCSPLOWO2_02_64_14]|nr:MAG: hypothetical protein A2W68_13480 [Betaproteobacteria bacterium RIFCSPLOWO2_02_64_14]